MTPRRNTESSAVTSPSFRWISTLSRWHSLSLFLNLQRGPFQVGEWRATWVLCLSTLDWTLKTYDCLSTWPHSCSCLGLSPPPGHCTIHLKEMPLMGLKILSACLLSKLNSWKSHLYWVVLSADTKRFLLFPVLSQMGLSKVTDILSIDTSWVFSHVTLFNLSGVHWWIFPACQFLVSLWEILLALWVLHVPLKLIPPFGAKFSLREKWAAWENEGRKKWDYLKGKKEGWMWTQL